MYLAFFGFADKKFGSPDWLQANNKEHDFPRLLYSEELNHSVEQ